MKLAISVILVLFSYSVFSQNGEGRVYVSSNPYGYGVSVRWAGPEIIYRKGINIYRKEGNKDFELLNKTPILPPQSIDENLDLEGNSLTFYEAFFSEDEQSFKEGFTGIFTLLESIRDFKLALALNIAYVDAEVEKGKKYKYRIEALKDGEIIELGKTETIKYQDFKPLTPPENFEFKRGRINTSIKWVNDEDKYFAYNIYLKKQGEEDYSMFNEEYASSVAAEAKKYFLKLPTHKDTVYYIMVEGLDYFGQKSEMTDEIIIPVKDFEPPAVPPLIVKVASKEKRIRISWKPSTEEDLSHYNLYRRLDDVDTAFIKINTRKLTAKDSVFLDNVDTHGTFSYQLEAVDESGNSAWSIPYFGEVADVFPPPVPQNLKATVDTGLFILHWDAVKADDLKGYVVMRAVADNNTDENNFLPVTAVIDTNYFEEPMAKNVRSPFVYVVKSVDQKLNKSLVSGPVIAQLPDVIPPVAPFIKKTYEEDNSLVIEWMPNMEKDLQGYNLYKKAKNDTLGYQKVNYILLPEYLKSYPDKEAKRGVLYEYYLEAVDNSDLISEKSNTVIGKLEHLDMSGEIEFIRKTFSKIKQEVILEWKTGKIINEPIVGMAVFRSVNGQRAFRRGDISLDNRFREKLSKPGNYEYHVRVFGERGNIIMSDVFTINIEKDK